MTKTVQSRLVLAAACALLPLGVWFSGCSTDDSTGLLPSGNDGGAGSDGGPQPEFDGGTNPGDSSISDSSPTPDSGGGGDSGKNDASVSDGSTTSDASDAATQHDASDSAASDASDAAAAADASDAGTDAGFNPCTAVSTANNGTFCGQSTEGSFASGSINDLYTCHNQQTSNVAPCPAGCDVAPAGQADVCFSDPCAAVTPNGTYCGRSHAHGFANGIANWVYTCNGSATAQYTICATGCTVGAGGTDTCASPDAGVFDAGSGDPCAAVPASGNGGYCGQSTSGGFASGIVDSLYHCVGGVTQGGAPTFCPAGCDINPGGADQCFTPDPCAATTANGVYCGRSHQNGFVDGLANWLYTCASHATTSHQLCANGCSVLLDGGTGGDFCN